MRKSELRRIIREEISKLRSGRLNEGSNVNTTYDASWKIAQSQGLNDRYVLHFMYDNNIDGVKLYSDIKRGKISSSEVTAAFVGDPGNRLQRMVISKYKNKVKLSPVEAKAHDNIIDTLVNNDVDVNTAKRFLIKNRIDLIKLSDGISSFRFPYDLIGAVKGTNKEALAQIKQEYGK